MLIRVNGVDINQEVIHDGPMSLDTFWEHSDVLDGPPQRSLTSYREGSNMLQFMLTIRSIEDDELQRAGREIFVSHKANCINSIAEFLRAVDLAKSRGWTCRIDPNGITPEEANAAWMILVYASEETQDQFLRGEPDFQKALIYAVLKDGGLYDHRGFWCYLVQP